jgi:Protein of unknown function (DUF4089)
MKRKAARKVKSAPAAESRAPGGKRAAVKTPAKAAAKKPSAKPKHDALDPVIAANAQALGLTLDPSWQDNIKFNLQLVLRHAALVDEFPLPDDAEPAPVFHA